MAERRRGQTLRSSCYFNSGNSASSGALRDGELAWFGDFQHSPSALGYG